MGCAAGIGPKPTIRVGPSLYTRGFAGGQSWEFWGARHLEPQTLTGRVWGRGLCAGSLQPAVVVLGRAGNPGESRSTRVLYRARIAAEIGVRQLEVRIALTIRHGVGEPEITRVDPLIQRN